MIRYDDLTRARDGAHTFLWQGGSARYSGYMNLTAFYLLAWYRAPHWADIAWPI